MAALHLNKILIVSNVMVVEEGGGGILPYLPTPFLTTLVVRMVFGIKYHGGPYIWRPYFPLDFTGPYAATNTLTVCPKSPVHIHSDFRYLMYKDRQNSWIYSILHAWILILFL